MRLILFIFVAMALTGCRAPEPAYLAAAVRADDALVGRWEAEAEPGYSLTITARAVDVREGRTVPPVIAGPEIRGAASAPAYRLEFTSSGKGWGLDAYLIESGGERYLGVQPGTEELLRSGLYGHVLPLHTLWRLRLEGDVLALQFPSRPIAWIPESPFGAASADGGAPTPARLDTGAMLLTTSIDDLLEEYTARAEDPDFWAEELRFRGRRRSR